MTNKPIVIDYSFNCIYVGDLPKAVAFYANVFGFTKKFDMPDGSVFGSMGKVDVWIGGGYTLTARQDPQGTRTSVMYGVASMTEAVASLKKHKAESPMTEPVNMGEKHWYQFWDPAGNLVEILGPL